MQPTLLARFGFATTSLIRYLNHVMSDLLHFLTVAKDAVQIGVSIARRVRAETERLQLEKTDKSPVTVADFAVQAIVARHLAAELSDFVLVGEESARDARENQRILDATVAAARTVWPEADAEAVLAAIDRGAGDPDSASFWTLDPIDGTKGFLRGEQYCISLAYVEQGRPVIGVLGCPNLPPVSMYYAVAGQGAFEEGGTRIHGSEPASGTITFCESVEEAHADQEGNRRLVESLGVSRVRSIRMDSQCKYAVVARGEADAYLRLPKDDKYVEKIWDHAAGSLVATEAGCVVSDVRGEPLDFSTGRRLERNRGVVVAARSLHARLIAALA
jgi:HAL2 family 3'(2'),5'-bisphosphate nucleotidase